MQKNNINRNTLGFSNYCQGNHKISQSQVRIHQARSVSEGDVYEWLLDYILVIFMVICVYYTCTYTCFCLVYTFDSIIGNVRSLVTNVRYEHRQVKSWQAPSTNLYCSYFSS